VDYPANLSSGRNWRVTAFAAAAFAALELVLLVILAVAAFGLPLAEERRARAQAAVGRTAPSDTERAPTRANGGGSSTSPVLQPRSKTSVVVLNGNGITGAADLASVDVRNRRYVLTGTGNAPRSDFRRTIVMYRPGFEGEAHRLVRDVGARRVAPLDGMRAADLMGAQLALIVGQR
jgi:hypothetical protein